MTLTLALMILAYGITIAALTLLQFGFAN